MFHRLRVGAAGFVYLVALGCGTDTPASGTSAVCQKDVDCPADQRCTENTCVPLAATGCKADGDCPDGLRCLPNGACQAAECTSSADCCPNGTECERTCDDFKCLGTECQDGEEKECFIGCHRGKKTCDRGEFQECDALPVAPAEKCGNTEDDDCKNGAEDGCTECQPGQEVTCSSPCGAGSQACVDGKYGPCSASTDCTCEVGLTDSKPCGDLCGHETGTCGPEGVMVWSGTCAAEGPCKPNTIETQDCGLCGSQTRICGNDCLWGEWPECSQEGECEAGATEQQGCTGVCGSEERTCSDTCGWGEWSDCNETGGCTIGDTQSKPCGNCGEQESTCDADCQWGAFGLCSGEGACKPGEVETDVCAQCGEQTRVCSQNCTWPSWGACTGQGECEPNMTDEVLCGPDTNEGDCQIGTAKRTCSAVCQWGAPGTCTGAIFGKQELCGDGKDQDCDGDDKTLPDDWESNDTCGTCAWLGQDPNKAVYGTFDQASDVVDYYCFGAIDNFNVVGFGEHILVDLLNQSSGIDGDIYLYRNATACAGGPSKAVAKSEVVGNGDEAIDWGETTGTSDDGTWIIEVRNFEPAAAGCYEAYTLHVNGLN